MKKKKLPIWEKRMKYGYNDNSFSWIWIYLLTLIFNRTWKFESRVQRQEPGGSI